MPFAQCNWRTSFGIDAARRWPISFVVAASVLVALALGSFLVMRRLTGALSAPLPPWQLVITAILLLAWALAVRTLLRQKLAAWLPATALLLFAVGCSFPGARAVDWLVWLTAFGAFAASHNAIAIAPAKPGRSLTEADHILQQLTRSRTADGHDIIHGTLLAEFGPGERTATLYVAFCPPFERLPHVELESSADAKAVQTLHNGAQLEVRLPRAMSVPTAAAVELFATDAE